MSQNKRAHLTLTTAGAGTGKTYSLVENYLSAVFGLDHSGVKKRPTEILALTFTQKASHEMRQRIALRLSGFIDAGHEDPLWEIMEEQGVTPPTPDEVRKLLRSLPQATIATFHGFCANLLRDHAQLLDLYPEFSILSGLEEKTFAKNILRSLVIDRIKSGDAAIKSLTARFRLGGSLRTTGLLESLLNLLNTTLEKGFDARYLAQSPACAITREHLLCGLNDVAEKLGKLKAEKLTPTAKERVEAVLRALGEVTTHFMASETELSFYYEKLINSVKGNFGPAAVRSELVQAIGHLGGQLVDFYLGDDERAIKKLLVDFCAELDQQKRQHACLSYGDLLLKTKDLLLKNPQVRQQVKLRYAHVLIDEYQDTSPLQEDIIALLIENKERAATFLDDHDLLKQVELNDTCSLFIVGDQKQSIYGFRGAHWGIFDRIEEKLLPGSTDFNFSKRSLTTNRRSTPAVIDLVNLVARHTLADQGYLEAHSLKTHSLSHPGHCDLWCYSEGLTNVQASALGVAQILHKQKFNPCDIAILVRKRSSATAIKNELMRWHIPARVVGGEGFFQDQNIVDLLAALKVIIDPTHEAAVAILLRSPLVLLTDQEILNLRLHEVGTLKLTWSNVMWHEANGLLSEASGKRVRAFAKAKNEITESLTKRDVAWAIEVVVDACDYTYSLGKNGAHDLSNLEKLKCLGLSKMNPHRLIDQWWRNISTHFGEPMADTDSAQDSVVIMTIHQSKGLEFEAVVLADAERSLSQQENDFLFDKSLGLALTPKGRPIKACLPQRPLLKPVTKHEQIRGRESELKEKEEARLLYVAMTRAKSSFYAVLSHAAFQRKKASGLMGVMMQAVRASPGDFSATLIEPAKPAPEVTKTPATLVPELPLVFERTTRARRLFSSMIEATEEFANYWHNVSCYDATDHSYGINGTVAHKLLAQSHATIFADTPPTKMYLMKVLNAGLRALGEEVEPNLRTLKACFVTLTCLMPSLRESHSVIFEKPLSSWPRADLLIEGMADLVMIKPDGVYVAEFKSSLKLARHPNTTAQLLAYCHALRHLYDLPIKFSPILIGSAKNPQWRIFDEQMNQLFIDLFKGNHLLADADAAPPKEKSVHNSVEVDQHPSQIGRAFHAVDENVDWY
jgi:ATP-dependent helicase/nuclease subunit A